jgi:hypothetical protein
VGTPEGTVIEVFVPDMVIEVVEPLASEILVNVVKWVELLLGSFGSTVPEQAPPTTILYLSELSSDQRCRYGSVGVSLLVVEDVKRRLLLVWGELLDKSVHKRGSG